MSFHYNKNGNHNQGESFWTSNSDLFLGLSSIFLLLYVVSSLRSGADGVNNATENKKLKVQIQDLQNQLKTYESVKEQYLQTQASKSEKDEYNELMDKLTLLQEEAKNEKENLTKEAQNNAKKELALNKYQQMVRNIINSNKFSQTKITNRNEVITEKEQVIDEKNDTITEQTGKINSLNKDISQKENLIRNKDRQIDQVEEHLAQKMDELKRTFKKAKLSQKAYQQRMKALQAEAEAKVANIEEQKNMTISELQKAKAVLNNTKSQLAKTMNQLDTTKDELDNTKGQLDTTKTQLSSTKGQLNETIGALDETQGQLNSTKGQLEKTKGILNKKSAEIANLSSQLNSAAAETQAKMDALQNKFAADKAAEKAAFENALRNQKNLSNAEIAKREGQFKAAAEAKERKLAGELAGLAGQLKSTEGQLNAVKAELQARKKIASEIKKGFDKIGVKADIDLESGDVLLDFGQAYFENDSSQLKDDMRNILRKAMPVYSKSLFGNPSVSSQISAVEVIGFASPTYRGKFVDPNSTSANDREALKYNMDLSYKRAKSIFNYILDEKEMNFEHRQTLVPNLKVSGRSFLDLMKMDRNVASAEEYCKKNDCKKSQRVIIRFSMDKRK
jgi:chromosome segregation ATPase